MGEELFDTLAQIIADAFSSSDEWREDYENSQQDNDQDTDPIK